MFGGFGIILLLAKIMSPYSIGVYYIYSAIGISASFILLGPLFYGVQRLYPGDDDSLADFVKSMFSVTVVTSISSLILNILIFSFWEKSEILLNTIAIFYFATGEALFSQTTNFNSINPERSRYFQAVLIRTASLFATIYVLHLFDFADHIWMILGAFSFSSIFSTVSSSSEWRRLYRNGRVRVSYLSEAFSFGWPYMVTQILRQPLERGDRLFVAMLIGPIAAGQLGMASDLARRTIQGLAINARLAFGRLVIRQFDDGDEDSAAQTLAKMMMMTIILSYPIAFGVSAFGAAVVAPILSGKLSGGAVDVLRIVPIAFCFEAIRLYVYEIIFELSRKTKYLINIAAVGVFIQVISFCSLGVAFGIKGIAVALVITHAAVLIVTIYFSKRVFNINLNMTLVFSLAFATVACGQITWIMLKEYLGFDVISLFVSLVCSMFYVVALSIMLRHGKILKSDHLEKRIDR